MKIQILCVGSLKEKYWKDAVKEYQKRLSSYCTINIDEVKEGRTKEEEGKSILAKIRPGSFVIALAIKGTEYSSEKLAAYFADLALYGKSQITIIIGGSDGLSDEVLEKAHSKISFSKLTYPHQMMRVILLEQIYRTFKINLSEIYHK